MSDPKNRPAGESGKTGAEGSNANGNNRSQKEKTIFRQKSLERIQSPEQINDYIRVVSPSMWLVLITVIALLISALIWSATAKLVMNPGASEADVRYVSPISFIFGSGQEEASDSDYALRRTDKQKESPDKGQNGSDGDSAPNTSDSRKENARAAA